MATSGIGVSQDLAATFSSAQQDKSTRFLKVFVENVPWLVERLGIKVLPCVICFIDGVSKDWWVLVSLS